MKKMWYIYTMEYYAAIKTNKTGSFVETGIDLETIIQSEVSQKEKNKFHILTHIYEMQKNGTDHLICKAKVETQTQRTNVWILGGKGVGSGERNREIGIDTYSLLIPSVKCISASLVYQIVKNMPAMQEPQV